MPRAKRITPTNVDNRLKMPEAGFARWRPQLFHERFNQDGSRKVVEGFKNTLTDREFIPPEGWNADLSRLDHGDLATTRHGGGRFSKEFWESLGWDENGNRINTDENSGLRAGH